MSMIKRAVMRSRVVVSQQLLVCPSCGHKDVGKPRKCPSCKKTTMTVICDHHDILPIP